jgi:hypothetical protein
MQNTQVYQMNQGFSIQITLQYLPWLVINTFSASFINAESSYYGTSNNSGLLQ